MLASYAPLFRVPGATQFMIGSVLSRIGGGMFGIAIVVMISQRRDSYALAGAINAVALLVLAVTAPVLAAMVDRYGQARIGVPFAVWTTLWSYVTALLSWFSAPVWTLFLSYALSAIVAEGGPMSRARWVWIFRDDPERRHTAMALEQVADEVALVLAPVIGVLAGTLWFPEAGLVVATTFYAVGLGLFLSSRSTEPPVVPHSERPAGVAIRRPGIAVIAAVLVMIGAVFGSVEVIAVAFAEESGNTSWSGVILGAWAFGSLVSALYFGTRSAGVLSQRLLWAAAAMVLLELPALVVPGPPALTVVMLVAGLATAPTLISALSLTERLVPRALVTEALAVATTALVIGLSLGAVIGGVAVERFGGQPSFVVPIAAGTIATLIVLVNSRRLAAAERAAERQ